MAQDSVAGTHPLARTTLHTCVDVVRPNLAVNHLIHTHRADVGARTGAGAQAQIDIHPGPCASGLYRFSLCHRLILKPEARVRQLSPQDLEAEVVASVPVPAVDFREARG